MEPELNDQYICPNCETSQPIDNQYCCLCGQKKKKLKPTIWEFIGELLNSVFNLDNKFFTSTMNLFVPGKLTRAFFQGKRQRFHHPLRIYFLSILLLFFILSVFNIDDVIKFDNISPDVSRFQAQSEAEVLRKTIDKYKLENEGSPGLYHVDSLRRKLYLLVGNDSIFIKDTLSDGRWSMNMIGDTFNISLKDIALKSTDELVEENAPKEWYNRLAFRQFVRIAKDPNSLNAFLFANLSWLFLGIVPLFAVVLKLLYIRRKKYYIEHLVFLLHLFSALIIFSSIMISIIIPTEINELSVVIFIAAVFFPLIAFKTYYQQSWIKTFLKFLTAGFFFTLTFIICFSIFLGITAILY